MSSSGGVAVGRVEQLVGLLRREAEPDQALARDRARVVRAPRVTTISSAHRARHLLPQLHDDPLGGALADARHRLEARRVARGDRRRAARAASRRESTASATFGPTLCTPDQHQEQLALVLGGEAEQVHAVVAHDRCDCEQRLAARRRAPGEGLRRDREPVADAAAVSITTSPGRRTATLPRTEAITPSAALSGAPLAWQMATARASAAWSGSGGSGSDSSAPTIRCTWALSALPEPHTACLTACGVYEKQGRPAMPAASSTDAARLADRERGAHVLAEVELLDRHGSGAVLGDQVADPRCGCGPGAARAARPRPVPITPPSSAASCCPRESDHAIAGVGGAGIDAEDDHHRW